MSTSINYRGRVLHSVLKDLIDLQNEIGSWNFNLESGELVQRAIRNLYDDETESLCKDLYPSLDFPKAFKSLVKEISQIYKASFGL